LTFIFYGVVSLPQPGQRINIYRQWIKKAIEHFGVTSTREIFEQAIEKLPEKVCGTKWTVLCVL
jgi:hypothetical protein